MNSRSWTQLGHMGHVRIFSDGEVVAFLRRIGFDIETVQSIARNFKSPRNWERRLVNGILHLFPHLRTSFSVIARKPESPAVDA